MPTAGDYGVSKAALVAATVSAFPKVLKIYFGPPRKEPKEIPYFVWLLDEVPSGMSGDGATVRSPAQLWKWTGIYVSQLPAADTNLLDYKAETGDLLPPLLEAGEVFAGVGMLPVVTRIGYAERFEAPEGACTVEWDFQYIVRRTWGT